MTTAYASTYSNNISRRARSSMIRRENQVRRQKKIITVAAAVFAVCLSLLLFTGIRTFAGTTDKAAVYKYYESVEIRSGDTIWELADSYLAGSGLDKEEYVSEILRLNNIPNGEIREGDTIVMVYYSTELK